MARLNLRAFGDYLRARMYYDRVKAADLARSVGCDRSLITLLRQGQREPSVSTLFDLERAIVGFTAEEAIGYLRRKDVAA